MIKIQNVYENKFQSFYQLYISIDEIRKKKLEIYVDGEFFWRNIEPKFYEMRKKSF